MDQNKLIEVRKGVGAHWKLKIIIDMLKILESFQVMLHD
jgi:hypothetical protein